MTQHIGRIITVDNREWIITGVHKRSDFFLVKEFGREFETIIAFDEVYFLN